MRFKHFQSQLTTKGCQDYLKSVSCTCFDLTAEKQPVVQTGTTSSHEASDVNSRYMVAITDTYHMVILILLLILFGTSS